ncbi:Reverse transcriptase [Theobroma cacao]|nr:Reverse transcriptase [Theobroma cacao]
MIARSDKHEYDPITFKEAINDADAEEWLKAMKSELDTMDSNKVWTLVDPLEGIKPIGCKWIYKRKRGSDRKVETFKVRLVAKGFTQREGINYEETFSPVAMLKSIRIHLSIAAHLDYEIRQMDVKITFLNGDLEERIYMAQLKGFIKKGQEDQLIRDRKNKQIALSQAFYIDKILVKFAMHDSKKGFMPFGHGVKLSKEMSPKTAEEVDNMRWIPYASAVESLIKKNYMLVCFGSDFVATRYTDSDFQSDVDSRKSTSGSVFTIGGRAIVWRTVKQSCIADSTMEAEYVAACEAAKEVVWLRKFLMELEVIPDVDKPITLYCYNSGAVANSKEPRNHKAAKHIEMKYHLIREIIQREEVIVKKIPTEQNLASTFTMTLTQKSFDGHLEGLGMRDMSYLLYGKWEIVRNFENMVPWKASLFSCLNSLNLFVIKVHFDNRTKSLF